MDPVTSAAVTTGVAKILDIGINLVLAGFERGPIVEKVRAMEAAGATPDEITDALQNLRQESEVETQAKIDAA